MFQTLDVNTSTLHQSYYDWKYIKNACWISGLLCSDMRMAMKSKKKVVAIDGPKEM